MSTNMTGFIWFSKIFAFLCFGKNSLSIGRVKGARGVGDDKVIVNHHLFGYCPIRVQNAKQFFFGSLKKGNMPYLFIFLLAEHHGYAKDMVLIHIQFCIRHI